MDRLEASLEDGEARHVGKFTECHIHESYRVDDRI